MTRTLVEQSRVQSELMARVDELTARTPRPFARDTAFEHRYLRHVEQQHNHITIYGIDLRDSPDRWPLEVACLSLEATADEERAAPRKSRRGPRTCQRHRRRPHGAGGRRGPGPAPARATALDPLQRAA
ncbi:hypothetical protein AQI70_09565 [Streptomyces curacoi]|uniref:Uncharacterized protein n=1 Tax=Streptomyces curacoi TaxID=146536 RepID=A0A117PHC6_9ACTN|nr:hypothetical protein AQI70_09565 [Streptomyces curacoi]